MQKQQLQGDLYTYGERERGSLFKLQNKNKVFFNRSWSFCDSRRRRSSSWNCWPEMMIGRKLTIGEQGESGKEPKRRERQRVGRRKSAAAGERGSDAELPEKGKNKKEKEVSNQVGPCFTTVMRSLKFKILLREIRSLYLLCCICIDTFLYIIKNIFLQTFIPKNY